MARRKRKTKKLILPDPLYKSEQLAKFINVLMRGGKKSVAENIVYKAIDTAFDHVKKDKSQNAASSSAAKKVAKKGKMIAREEALEVLKQALSNVRPMVEVKSRRVGGATYQVPVEVNLDRGLALAMRWVIGAAKGRSGKTMIDKLAAELVDAYKGVGAAIKIRDDMHRMAKANQAFAHYRW